MANTAAVIRVLYVDLCPSPGGSIFSLYHLVTHLDRQQVQPLVALATVNPFRGFEEAGVPVVRVRVPRWERPLPPPAAGAALSSAAGDTSSVRLRLRRNAGGVRRLLRDILPVTGSLRRSMTRFQPHLVHLNDILPLNQAGALACRLNRVPAVEHCRSFETPSPTDIHWLLPAVHGMIFISQAIAAAHLAVLPPLRHSVVIPNALDLADYDKSANGAPFRAELGLPPETALLVMAGRISPWKGQHVFIEALAQLRTAGYPVHGALVGLAEEADGPGYAAQVQAQAQALGLADALHITGFRADMPQVLAAADVVVHCSVKPEPFGRVIIEGMAAARPTVASALGGALEIITPGVDGLLTPAGDVEALVSALQGLLDDPQTRLRLGTAARRTVAERYQVQAHVDAVQTFYQQVLADRT
ncbi:MAG: glycosyltransferase family 4 protein [Caldilineales bacterium]